MTIKEELEYQEHKRLNPKASFADQSKGRPREEAPREGDVRTCYQRDTDRIVHSKSFRRPSSSPVFLMMYSAYKLNKQGDNIQP